MQHIKECMDKYIQEGLAPKPPPPVQESYVMFGNQFQGDDLIIQTLESQGIQRASSYVVWSQERIEKTQYVYPY